ncbi:MAG: hypothetical protein ACO3S5_12635, partial [Ilumatobacteraceae bacterium]
CRPCTDAHAANQRERRRRARQVAAAVTPKPEPDADADKPQRRYAADLTNLRHAMTIEDHQAREAANPDARPVTQDPIQRRASDPVQSDRTSVIDVYLAGES